MFCKRCDRLITQCFKKIQLIQARRISNKNYERTAFSLESVQRKFDFPDRDIAEELLEAYPDPQGLVERINSPLTTLSSLNKPRLKLSARSFVPGWRATLEMVHPMPFTVGGQGADQESAIRNAYLMACQTYRDLGLTDQLGNVYDYKKKLLSTQDSWKHVLEGGNQISFQSTCDFNGPDKLWTCHCSISLPLPLEVTAYASSQEDAEQLAAAKILVKLQAHHFLDRNMTVFRNNFLTIPKSTSLQGDTPDYEVYVDASRRGYGAYLKKPDDDANDKIFWIHEEWPQTFLKEGLIYNTYFIELYAFVETCFTYKKKFMGQKIMVMSDNLSVISAINLGVNLDKCSEAVAKLYMTLYDVVYHYKIDLRVLYIKREDNYLADHLAKCDMDCFRAKVPHASTKSKKTKKLWFLHPFRL